MRKKTHHLLIAVLILVLFFTMALMFIGCSLGQQLWDAREETSREAAEREIKEEQKEEIRAWEENEESIREDESIDAEEESSLLNEPVTYNGNLEGLPVIFVVNFKTTEVTGSLACPVEGYPDYVFTDGKVDPDTLEVTARSTGIRELDSDGNVIQTQEFIITGKISGDLSTINGVIANNFDESFEFIATK